MSIGFAPSAAESCVYVRASGESITYLLIYVDDTLLTGNDEDGIKMIKQQLSAEFKIRDLEEIKTFMGLSVSIDHDNGVLEINHPRYAKRIVERFDMDQSKPVATPIEPRLCLDRNTDAEPVDVPYREAIGSLMYLMKGSRPDLCFAVNYLSRF